MESKCCDSCNEYKLLHEFSIRKLKDGTNSYRNECKKCRCLREIKRRQENKKAFQERDKKFYEQNKDKIRERQQEYNEQNRDSICKNKKKYYEQNREKILEYHVNNKDKRNVRIREKRQTDITFKIIENLKSRIHSVLKNKKKTHTNELIGCTKEQLLNWLESQFDDKMTWENYGIYWHIDHVLAVTLFEIEILEYQYLACHWSNLKPLEKIENISKSNKIIPEYVKKHVKHLKEFIIQNEGYQANIEKCWWRRIQLRYGDNPEDREDFENILKWVIRNETISDNEFKKLSIHDEIKRSETK